MSSLVKYIRALALNAAQDRLRSEMFESAAPNPFRVSQRAIGLGQANHALSVNAPCGNGELDISVPIHIRIKLGELGVALRDP